MLAHRLRAVLENHSGIAALLKTRDPLSPASLALAEAFLAALHAATCRAPGRPGLPSHLRLHPRLRPGRPRLARRATPWRQRGQTATYAFLRSLPASSFPTLATHGTHAWADDREERFTLGLDTLICGLQAAQRSRESSHAS